MDNDMLDLADRLCTVAGMLMEDHNFVATTTAAVDVGDRASRLDTLKRAADDMRILIEAAQVLTRLG